MDIQSIISDAVIAYLSFIIFSGGFQGCGVVLCRLFVALRIASHSGSYSRFSDEPGLSGTSMICSKISDIHLT